MKRENKSKLISYVIFSLLLGSILVTLITPVHADAAATIRNTIGDIQSSAGPLFQAILGDKLTTENLFTSILFFLLLYIVLFSILGKIDLFSDKRGVQIILSLAISILSIRFIINEGYLYDLLLGYGTLGTAIITLFPFMLFFWFLYHSNVGSMGRRLGWSIFVMTYIILGYGNNESVGGFIITRGGFTSDLGQALFIGTIIMGIVALLFDGAIQHYFFGRKLYKFTFSGRNRAIAKLQAEYRRLIGVNTPEGIASRKEILKEIRQLGSDIS